MGKSIAIVVCAWPPQGGGLGNNAYYQAKKLFQRGWRVGVFTPDFSGIAKDGFAFALNNLSTKMQLGKAGFMFGLFKALNGYDIIHLYYPFFGSDLLVWLFKKKHHQIKLILHYEMDPIAGGLKGLIFWLYVKFFLGLVVKASERVGVLSFDHVQNSYLKTYLKRWPGKFIELPNGVDTEIFRPQEKSRDLLTLNNFSVQDKIILFVSGLDKQHYFKGVPILLEAFKKIPTHYFPDVINGETQRGVLKELLGEAKLLIVGEGDLRQEFEQLAGKLGISDRVRFMGWIKNEDLPKYYSLADVFVLPSTARVESFGIVVAEAQASGVSVIVSDWPGVRTTLEPGQTGFLIRPGDSDDLAAKLKLLLNDDNLRRQLGSAGAIRAREKYSWNKITDELEKIYLEL